MSIFVSKMRLNNTGFVERRGSFKQRDCKTSWHNKWLTFQYFFSLSRNAINKDSGTFTTVSKGKSRKSASQFVSQVVSCKVKRAHLYRPKLGGLHFRWGLRWIFSKKKKKNQLRFASVCSWMSTRFLSLKQLKLIKKAIMIHLQSAVLEKAGI